MRRHRSLAPLRLLLALALIGSPAHGTQGGTITDEDASFAISLYGEEPRADLLGVSPTLGSDHLVLSGWWYRFPGDTRETPFPPPDVPEEWIGDEAQLDWADLDDAGDQEISVGEHIKVWDQSDSPHSGYVTRNLALHNPTDDPVVIDLFHYVDIDLAGATSDAARLVEYTPDRIIAITDSGGLVGAFVADWDAGLPPSGITHRVATYASNLRGELNDANVDNFTNTGLPFAAGDITAVFQYHLTIPAHGNRNLEAWIVVGFASGRCDSNAGIFCDGFENGAKTLWNEGL